jgi:hypothetical protein
VAPYRTYFADSLATADLGASSTRSQKVRVEESKLILAVRTWLVFNDPTFTNLRMCIYSDSAGVPGSKLSSSASRTKASIMSAAYAAKELAFKFNEPAGVALAGSTWYHLLLEADGYTADDNHHIAWRKDWPVPVYQGFAPTAENLAVAPYAVTLLGANLE